MGLVLTSGQYNPFDLVSNMPLRSPTPVKVRFITLVLGLLLACLVTAYAATVPGQCLVHGGVVNSNQDCPVAIFSVSQKLDAKTVSQRPFVSTGWLLDAQGYEDALKLSERYNVPILVYAYTDWCQYCRRLEQSLLRDVQVNQVMSQFVKVKINPENSEANQRLFRQWGGRGFPTLFVQGVDNHQPKRIRGPFSKQNGRWKIMGRVEFMQLLGAWL